MKDPRWLNKRAVELLDEYKKASKDGYLQCNTKMPQLLAASYAGCLQIKFQCSGLLGYKLFWCWRNSLKP